MLKQKLGVDAFVERINTDIDCCSVPDIWEQAEVVKKFEFSVFDSILYENSKKSVHAKKTSNELVKGLALPISFNYDNVDLYDDVQFSQARNVIWDAIVKTL